MHGHGHAGVWVRARVKHKKNWCVFEHASKSVHAPHRPHVTMDTCSHAHTLSSIHTQTRTHTHKRRVRVTMHVCAKQAYNTHSKRMRTYTQAYNHKRTHPHVHAHLQLQRVHHGWPAHKAARHAKDAEVALGAALPNAGARHLWTHTCTGTQSQAVAHRKEAGACSRQSREAVDSGSGAERKGVEWAGRARGRG